MPFPNRWLEPLWPSGFLLRSQKTRPWLLLRRVWFPACLVLVLLLFLRVFGWLQGARLKAEEIISKWDARRHTLEGTAALQWAASTRRPAPVPVSMCRRESLASGYSEAAQPHAHFEFAVVAMLTEPRSGRRFHHFQVSAAKLLVSLRTWSPVLAAGVDYLLVVAVSQAQLDDVDMSLLTRAGWTLCFVDTITSPPVEHSNRFLDSNMFTRLVLWKLVEYSAVLSMDTDMVVARDIAPIFTEYYPQMLERGLNLSAVRDFPLPCPATPDLWAAPTFNAGLLLLIPSLATFGSLNSSICNTAGYDTAWAEQGLLNAAYPEGSYVELPSVYNSFTAKKACNESRWAEEEDKLAVVHYTAVKGWGLEVVNPGVLQDMITRHNEFNAFGCFQWDVVEYCYIWEMIPTEASLE